MTLTSTVALLFVIISLFIFGFAIMIKSRAVAVPHRTGVTVGLTVSTALTASFLIMYFLNVLPTLPKTLVYLYLITTVATSLFFGVIGFKTKHIGWAAIILVLNTLIIFLFGLGLFITSM